MFNMKATALIIFVMVGLSIAPKTNNHLPKAVSGHHEATAAKTGHPGSKHLPKAMSGHHEETKKGGHGKAAKSLPKVMNVLKGDEYITKCLKPITEFLTEHKDLIKTLHNHKGSKEHENMEKFKKDVKDKLGHEAIPCSTYGSYPEDLGASLPLRAITAVYKKVHEEGADALKTVIGSLESLENQNAHIHEYIEKHHKKDKAIYF